MIRWQVTTPSGKTISGFAPSLETIEANIYEPERDDPEIVPAIIAKYGAPDKRQRHSARQIAAWQYLKAVNFGEMEAALEAVIAANPTVAIKTTAQQCLLIARALKALAIVVRQEVNETD